MAHTHLAAVLQHFRKLLGPRRVEEESDGRLLERFAREQDQSAFATLMARHGPMVLGACRRILRDEHDAEDVFQATFVVLARRARALDGAGSVANWLHTVAYRLALRARAGTVRRRALERQVADMPPPESVAPDSGDLRPLLDEALQALPEKYRAPLVLCYLEGKTTDEAAHQLGCPFGTVSSRLARGKDLLRQRLTRRGVTLSAGALATALIPDTLAAAVPAHLLTPSLKAATLIAAGHAATSAGLSASAAALAEGALREMLYSKVKTAVVMLLAVALFAAGVAHSLTRADAPVEAAAPAAASVVAPPPADTYGDPLPPGAIARIGTVRLQHEGGAGRCCFTPDGKTLASGGLDGTIRFWDVANGKELRVFRGHTADIRNIAFAPDGKVMASTGTDRTVRLWDVATGKELHTLTGHQDIVLGLAFAPDGKTLVSSDRANAILQWETATGKELPGIIGQGLLVNSLVYTPDGRTLLSAGYDQHVRLWEIATAKERQCIEVGNSFRGVWLSPDGKRVAVERNDNAILILDIATNKELHRFPANETGSDQTAFSPDGRLFASARHNGLMLWDLTSGKTLCEAKLDSLVVALAFTADSKTLATTGDTSIRFWDTQTGQELVKVPSLPAIHAVCLSPDGKVVATTGTENVIRLWEADTGKQIRKLEGHTGAVAALAFAPDGKTLVSGAKDGTLRLWEASTGKERKQWSAHLGGVTTVAFSRDGQTLASGGADKAIRLWESDTGKEIRVLTGHQQSVAGVAFAPDGKTLVSAGGIDPTLRLWDTDRGKELRQFINTPVDDKRVEEARRRVPLVCCVAFSPDGKTIAAAVYGPHPIRMFNVATGEELPALPVAGMQSILTLAFSPDGKSLACGDLSRMDSEAHRVRIWDVGAAKPQHEYGRHGKAITSLSYSADGKRLATGSSDRTALIWDLSRPAE